MGFHAFHSPIFLLALLNRPLAGVTKDAVLLLEVNDEDVFKDDHVGTASIPLAQLGPETPAAALTLQNSKGAATGTLHVQIVIFDVRCCASLIFLFSFVFFLSLTLFLSPPQSPQHTLTPHLYV